MRLTAVDTRRGVSETNTPVDDTPTGGVDAMERHDGIRRRRITRAID